MVKVYYPGVLMVPLVLLVLAVAAALAGSGIGSGMIQGGRVWSYWPVTLIATGMEELYLWATAGKTVSRRVQ